MYFVFVVKHLKAAQHTHIGKGRGKKILQKVIPNNEEIHNKYRRKNILKKAIDGYYGRRRDQNILKIFTIRTE